MSDTTISLHRKIERAKDLKSVVSTMKALAAASIGQYEKSAFALEDYHRTVQLGLSVCFRANSLHGFPIKGKARADSSVTGAVVFGSDQGLVGQFNDFIAEYVVRTLGPLPGRKKIWAVGKRVQDRLVDLGLAIEGSFTVPASIQGVTPLTREIMLSVLMPGSHRNEARVGGKDRNELSQLYLFYNSPRSESAHAPFHQRLLPLDEAWRMELSQLPWPSRNLPEVVGSNIATLSALIRESLFVSLFRACAESLASENASRLVAMERAEKNIDELSASLQQTFNRLRQSQIDAELFDVIAGVEAVRKIAK